jgi:uncharacterized protein (TIGR02597 family)
MAPGAEDDKEQQTRSGKPREEKDMRHKASAIAVVVLLAFAATAGAQVGRIGRAVLTVPATADAKLVIPFNSAIHGQFTVATKTATGVTATQFGAEPPVAAGQFDKGAGLEDFRYHVRFVGGNATGLWISIDNITIPAGVITFVFDATSAGHRTNLLAQVNVGDTFRVYRHHTLSTVFPRGLFGTAMVDQTTVFFYKNNTGAMQQNPAAAASAVYSVASGHKWLGTGATRPILPETWFIVRNQSAQPLKIPLAGVMPDYKVSMLIAPNGDLTCGSGYPMPVALKASQLGGTLQRTAFFYDNTKVEYNGAAANSATWLAIGSPPVQQWVGTGSGNSLPGSEAVKLRLPAGEGQSRVYITKPY